MKILILAGLLSFSLFCNADDIILSRTIDSKLRETINQDLEELKSYTFSNKVDLKLLKILNLPRLDSVAAMNWLEERVQYMVSEEDTKTQRHQISIVKENVVYPNQATLPLSLTSEIIKTNVMMDNIGASLYWQGKSKNKIYQMRVFGENSSSADYVSLASPRAGIIKIGAGLTDLALFPNQTDVSALANKIFRLSILFHEARHSDGNGKSLAFMHSICPAGHTYAGAAACDESLNGAYTVGGLMLKELAVRCKDQCNEIEKENLKLIQLDTASRVLTKTIKEGKPLTNWDANPESAESL